VPARGCQRSLFDLGDKGDITPEERRTFSYRTTNQQNPSHFGTFRQRTHLSETESKLLILSVFHTRMFAKIVEADFPT
jgi:hypothetical protein